MSPANNPPWFGAARILSSAAAFLGFAVVVASLTAALGVHRVAPASRLFAVDSDVVVRPSRAELASLRGSPAVAHCGYTRTTSQTEMPPGRDIEQEQGRWQCELARFDVSIHAYSDTQYDQDVDERHETWRHGDWTCRSDRQRNGSYPSGPHRRYSLDERTQRVEMRSSPEGDFAEYTCRTTVCHHCLDAACVPGCANPEGAPDDPGPRYFRRRDVRGPVTRAAFVASLLALLALVVLRISAARVAPATRELARSPYRPAPSAPDPSTARRHAVVLIAITAILLGDACAAAASILARVHLAG